jgi:hypothetical protein
VKFLAREVVVLVLTTIPLILVLAGVADLVLFLDKVPTISVWLRQHPVYFWVPAVLMVLFIVLLALHLFVWTWPE